MASRTTLLVGAAMLRGPRLPLVAQAGFSGLLLWRRIRKRRLLLLAALLHEQERVPRRVNPHRFHIADIPDDDTAVFYFRFKVADLRELSVRLALPPFFITRGGFPTDSEEAILITLARLAYPGRLRSLYNGHFERHESELSEIFLTTCHLLHTRWVDRIRCWRDYFAPPNILPCAAAVAAATGIPGAQAALFLDGTSFQICRPGGVSAIQGAVFNGNHRFHGINFLAFAGADGIVPLLFGPFQGSATDLNMFNDVRGHDLLHALLDPANLGRPPGTRLFCYADQIFPLSDIVLGRFPSLLLTPLQQQWNQQMNGARVEIEHVFSKVKTVFSFTHWFAKMQMGKSPIGIFVKLAFFLTNCHTCLYGNQTSQRFNITPPTLTEYLS